MANKTIVKPFLLENILDQNPIYIGEVLKRSNIVRDELGER